MEIHRTRTQGHWEKQYRVTGFISREVKDADWKIHHGTIKKHFLPDRNGNAHTLSDVRKIMATQHNFYASEAQYKKKLMTKNSKWKIEKKIPKATMIAIHKIEDRRRLHESKETNFTFHNQLLSKEKIERSRKRFSCLGKQAGPPSPLPSMPPSIGYKTPRSHTPDTIDLCSSPRETSMDTNTLETVISYRKVPQTNPELTESHTAFINSDMQTIPRQNPHVDFSEKSSATDTTIDSIRRSRETSNSDQYTYRNQLSVDIMEPAANIGEQLRHRNHLEWHAEALEKFKTILGTDYPNVGRLLYNISQILEREEGSGNSLEWTQKPEKWFMIALLKEDKQQLVTHIVDGLRDRELLYTLGKVCHCQGRYANALEWYQKALVVQRLSQGLQNQTTADIMYSMGAAYYKRWHWHAGDPENAERWFECALEVYNKALPTEHHIDWIMTTACLIGVVCYKKGDCIAAKRWLDWGLARRDSNVDPAYSEQLNSSNSFDRAIQTFRKLQDTLASYYGGSNQSEIELHSLPLGSLYNIHDNRLINDMLWKSKQIFDMKGIEMWGLR